MNACLKTNSTELNQHQNLVKLISEISQEIDLKDSTEDYKDIKFYNTVLSYLLELQSITSQKLRGLHERK